MSDELKAFLESTEFQEASNKVSPHPLASVAREAGIKYNSLVKAAQQGRIRAWKDGTVWMTSLDALELARSVGKIRQKGGK